MKFATLLSLFAHSHLKSAVSDGIFFTEELSKLLEKIGVPKEIAAEDACKIEHAISATTFECIKKSIENHKKFE